MIRRPLRSLAVVVAVATLALACAARPVVYSRLPGGSVDQAALDRDVDECTALARRHAREGGAFPRDAARRTATGGAVGAATGAVAGAIWGSAGRGAATGAAVGATSGLIRALLGRAPGEDPVERRYVERCLTERGYDVIGWR